LHNLINSDNTEKDKDADTSWDARIDFTPSWSRTLKIVVKNYDSDTPNYASKCWVIVAYK